MLGTVTFSRVHDSDGALWRVVFPGVESYFVVRPYDDPRTFAREMENRSKTAMKALRYMIDHSDIELPMKYREIQALVDRIADIQGEKPIRFESKGEKPMEPTYQTIREALDKIHGNKESRKNDAVLTESMSWSPKPNFDPLEGLEDVFGKLSDLSTKEADTLFAQGFNVFENLVEYWSSASFYQDPDRPGHFAVAFNTMMTPKPEKNTGALEAALKEQDRGGIWDIEAIKRKSGEMLTVSPSFYIVCDGHVAKSYVGFGRKNKVVFLGNQLLYHDEPTSSDFDTDELRDHIRWTSRIYENGMASEFWRALFEVEGEGKWAGNPKAAIYWLNIGAEIEASSYHFVNRIEGWMNWNYERYRIDKNESKGPAKKKEENKMPKPLKEAVSLGDIVDCDTGRYAVVATGEGEVTLMDVNKRETTISTEQFSSMHPNVVDPATLQV